MSDAWLGTAAVAAGVFAATLLAWALRSRAQQERARAPLARSIDASQARLADLQRRLAAGEITPQAFDDEQKGIAAGLLDGAAAAPHDRPRHGTAVFAGALLAAAIAAGGFHLWATRAADRPPAVDATEAAAAATANTTAPSSPKADDRPVHALTEEQLQRTVDQAGAQVKKTPSDAAAWAMLAHSYDMLGKFAESSKAYETLARLLPKDAQVLADYADALAVANGRTLEGKPTELVKQALAIDPRNLKALALAGTAAYERKDYPEAVSFWERARAMSTDPAFMQQVEGSIAEARAAARGESASAPVAAVAKGGGSGLAPGAAVVSGRITLADDLVAKASPDATVYIFARPAQGSRMPVALMRKHVRDLPVDFMLDDSTSMVPSVKLSQVQTVVIGARVSKRGDVSPQPGDMQGWSAPVPVGTRGIRLEISEVLK